MTERGALIGIEVVASQLAAGHPTDGVDEVRTVEIFKPVLVRVVSVGTTEKVVGRRILPTLLITCILGFDQYTCNDELWRTYAVTFLVEHEGSNSPSSVGADTSLSADPDSGTAPSVLILSSGNGTSGHRHDRVSGDSVRVEITEVVDGGTTSQWCSLYPFPVRTIAGPERTDHLVSSGSSPTSITKPHHSSV